MNIVRRYKGTLTITPTTSLVSDCVKITGEGFPSHSPITVTARAHCESQNFSFRSYVHINTCAQGTFDMTTSESVGGSYTGVDGMGLFWSMSSDEGYKVKQMKTNDASVPVQYDFGVLNGHSEEENDIGGFVCSASIERHFMGEGVTHIVVSQPPFHATVFKPPGPGPFPAIITSYGGMQHGKVIEDAASMFANQGYVTMVVAFYGKYEGLPRSYLTTPLRVELFEAAVEYLKTLDYVNGDAIGAWGRCQGASNVLAMACFLGDDIKAVVAVNALMYSIGTTMTYRDAVIPNGSFDRSKLVVRDDGVLMGRETVYNCHDVLPSVFPVEKSCADLLIIAGTDDHNSPSVEHADFAAERMLAHGRTNFKVVKLEGMGHLVDTPYAPPCTIAPHIVAPGHLFYYGGGDDVRLHWQQVGKVWESSVAFFDHRLKGNVEN